MSGGRGFAGIARHTVRYPRLYAAAVKARTHVRRAPTEPAAALEFARTFTWHGGRLRPSQSTEEVLWLAERLRELGPATVVEIGTDEAGTLLLWTRVATPDALLVAVDSRPLGPLGQLSPYAIVRRAFALDRQRVELVMPVDSHSTATVERVRGLLGDRRVDFLFIDGDHSYDGVRRDFELWSPLVRPGGLIAFHDTGPGPHEGVIRFWQELAATGNAEARAASTEPRYGIGIYRVPGDAATSPTAP